MERTLVGKEEKVEEKKEVGEEEEKEEGWMWSAVRLRDIDQGCCRHLRPTHSPTAILHLNPTCKQTSSG